MGVIRNIASLQNANVDSIEDVLENIEDHVPNYEVEVRTVRKIKHRSGRPRAVGDSQQVQSKGGKRRRQRIDNANFLLTLADPDETFELSIHDFIAPSISVFSRVLDDQGNMEIWHDFINCTDHEAWFQNITLSRNEICSDEGKEAVDDKRIAHPAFLATECFRKIDGDLRIALRRKHVPMGALMYLERELVTFFMNRPQSIFHSHIPNSFQRLLLHALCQYMDLGALSYDRNGARWTRVRNNNPTFQHPVILLSTYLEQRMRRATPNQ